MIFSLFALFIPFPVLAASLSLSPESGVFNAGSTFTVSVKVATPDKPMNAVSGIISFPNDILQVVSVSKIDSIINLWVQEPSYSNFDGTVNLEGVALNPGFSGVSGRIISVTFRAKKEGKAALAFTSGSVLANDGQGTNILSSLLGANYTIRAQSAAGGPAAAAKEIQLPSLPTINSPTHPEESKWYNLKNLDLDWSLPPGVDGVSYVFNSVSDFTPPSQSQGLVAGASYGLSQYADGAWRFHLRFHDKNGWGPTAHRTVRVDLAPPSAPFVERKKEDDPTNPQPIFTWRSEDLDSGIAFYQVKVGNGDWFSIGNLTGPYTLPRQAPGEHSLVVRVYDNAGNSSDTAAKFEIKPIAAPKITNYSQKIRSPQQALTAEGTALPEVKINLYLRKGKDLVLLSAMSDVQGRWSASYKDNMSAGLWELKAQAVDGRGALSEETPPVVVEISGWVGGIIRLFAEWGILILMVIVLGGLIAAATYLIIYRLKLWRIMLKKDLWKLKEELQQDLKALDKDLAVINKKDNMVDLSPAAMRKVQEHIKKDVAQIEENVKEEIKKIDSMGK